MKNITNYILESNEDKFSKISKLFLHDKNIHNFISDIHHLKMHGFRRARYGSEYKIFLLIVNFDDSSKNKEGLLVYIDGEYYHLLSIKDYDPNLLSFKVMEEDSIKISNTNNITLLEKLKNIFK